MEHAKRQSRIRVYLLRLLLHMRLFLRLLELAKQMLPCVNYNRLQLGLLAYLRVFFHQMRENSMVYGQSLKLIELLDQF
jgi:hypothetical protein